MHTHTIPNIRLKNGSKIEIGLCGMSSSAMNTIVSSILILTHLVRYTFGFFSSTSSYRAAHCTCAHSRMLTERKKLVFRTH